MEEATPRDRAVRVDELLSPSALHQVDKQKVEEITEREGEKKTEKMLREF